MNLSVVLYHPSLPASPELQRGEQAHSAEAGSVGVVLMKKIFAIITLVVSGGLLLFEIIKFNTLGHTSIFAPLVQVILFGLSIREYRKQQFLRSLLASSLIISGFIIIFFWELSQLSLFI